MTVQEFKKAGPFVRMGDLARAKSRFKSIVDAGDFIALCAARDEYAKEAAIRVRAARDKGATPAEADHYILHMSSFLGRWQDFLPDDWDRGELLFDEAPENCDWCKGLGRNVGARHEVCARERAEYADWQAARLK